MRQKYARLAAYIAVCLIATAACLSPPMAALAKQASDVTTNGIADEKPPPPTCRLTMRVTDNTGAGYNGDITVTLTQQFDGNENDPRAKVYIYLLRQADSAYGAGGLGGGIDCGEILADNDYGVAISYPDPDKYAITYSTGAIPRFCHATSQGLFLDFVITIIPQSGGESDSDNTPAYNGDSEGDKLYIAFEAAMEGARLASEVDGSKWSRYFDNEKWLAGGYTFAAMFADIYGVTEDVWKALSPYEMYMKSRTCAYLISKTPQYCADPNVIKWLMEDEKGEAAYMNDIDVRYPLAKLRELGDGGEGDAFEALMRWQYRHYKATGSFYNFATHKEQRQAVIEAAEARQAANGGVAVLPGQSIQEATATKTEATDEDGIDDLKKAMSDFIDEISAGGLQEDDNAATSAKRAAATPKKGGIWAGAIKALSDIFICLRRA